MDANEEPDAAWHAEAQLELAREEYAKFLPQSQVQQVLVPFNGSLLDLEQEPDPK